MHDLTLITCTGNRQHAFTNCEKYIARQTHQNFHWMVIDDGEDPTKCHHHQEHVRLSHVTNPRESFRTNYIEAIQRVQTPFFVVIEDDDWYSRWYLEFIYSLLKSSGKALVGESRAKYYNVRFRAWKVHGNRQHASLCQTGFQTEKTKEKLLNYLRTSRRPQQLDGTIWKRSRISNEEKLIIPTSTHCIAIKGVFGRPGLGIDHSFNEIQNDNYCMDPEMNRLHSWIGDDANAYEQYHEYSTDC